MGKPPKLRVIQLEKWMGQTDEVLEAKLNLLNGGEHLIPTSLLAARMQVTDQTVVRWRREGIPLYSADEIACKLGVHPAVIWKQDFYEEVNP